MKIAFVLPLLLNAGGVRVVFEYSNRLQQKGHEVTIIYPLIPSTLGLKFSIKKMIFSPVFWFFVNLKRRNTVEWFTLSANIIGVLTINRRFARLFEKAIPDFDAIIATSWETAYFVNALSQKKGEKFYFVQHYEIWPLWNNLICWDMAQKIEIDTEKVPIAMSSVVPKNSHLSKMKNLVDATYLMPLSKITISSWLKELIETKFGQAVNDFIPNGVNFELFYCNEGKDWASEKKILLMPYRGIPWKGDADGLKALNIIHEKFGDKVQIFFYGPKKMRDLPDYIQFFEGIDDIELRKLYCRSHILIIPSWVEGSHLPPMEGMACKCACVLTNVGGVPDYAIPDETALVVPPHQPQEIARAIDFLLENPEQALRIAERGYNHIVQFSWDKAADAFEKNLFA